MVAVLAVLLVLAAAGIGVAASGQYNAAEERDQALIHEVLSQAKALRSSDAALAVQLALAAYRLEPDAESRSAVLDMLDTPYAAQLARQSTPVSVVAVSPNGRVIAVADGNDVRLWDIGDGAQPQLRATINSRVAVNVVAFSPDGRTLATAGGDMAIRLWHVADVAKPAIKADLPGFGTVTSMSFSHDGRLLAEGTVQGGLQLWSVEGSGQPQRVGSTTVDGEIQSVAFNGADHTLAVDAHNQDRSVSELRDADDPGRPLATLPATSPGPGFLAYSPDGKTVAKGNADGTIGLWDVTDRHAPKNIAVLPGPAGGVQSLVFSPNGGTLAASGKDANVLLWTVADPSHPVVQPSLTGFGTNVSTLAYLPDGHTLLVGGENGSARLERLADYTFAAHANGVVTSVAFSPDGRTLAAGVQNGNNVELRDVADLLDPWAVPANLGIGGRVALAPQGNLMVVGNALASMNLWDTKDIRRPSGPRLISPYPFISDGPLAFSRDGRVLADGGFGRVVLWDTSNQSAPRQLAALPPGTDVTWSVALSPTGRLLAQAGTGKTTALWDVSGPHPPRQVVLLPGLAPGPVRAVAFNPDGRMLAVSSDDNTVRLWDVNDLNRPMMIGTLAGHTGSINALAFSPDGRTLATGSNDNTARLWDVHDPHRLELIATLAGHNGSVNALAYSSDGRTLATGSSDRGIGLWDTDVEHVATHLCDLAWPRISRGDWQRYLPGFDYQPPCPV